MSRSASASAVPVRCAWAEASTMGLGVVSGTVKAMLFACTRRVGDRIMVARLPETVNSWPVNEPEPSSVIIGGKPGKRSTPTSRVVNSPCRLSRGKPRLCSIASRSAAVQLARIDPWIRPPCRLRAHHSRTSGLMNSGHRRMRSDVALGPASMLSLSEEPAPSGALSALTATSTVGPRAVRPSRTNWDVGSRKRASRPMDSSTTAFAPGRSGPKRAPRDSRCAVQTLAASAGGATQPCASTCVSPART